MSEAYGEAEDAAGDDDAAEIEAAENEDEAGQAGDDEGGEPRKRARDPEAELHNVKGQAAKERSRRRAAETRARELEERLERIEARTSRGGASDDADELMSAIASLRDDEDDPIGDISAVKKALKAFRARQEAEMETETRQAAVTRQFQKLQTSMAESESDFAQDFPDYHDAAKHYREARQQELEDAGYTGVALQRKLADDLYGVVRMALEGGLDPAERVYALAKRRGFKAGASATDKKIDVLNKAGQAGRRPTGAPAGGGVLSWDDVAKLDGAARDKAFAKLRERERARR